MSGHGHVIPNENGVKARCGGPGLCETCRYEYALKHGKTYDSEKHVDVGTVVEGSYTLKMFGVESPPFDPNDPNSGVAAQDWVNSQIRPPNPIDQIMRSLNEAGSMSESISFSELLSATRLLVEEHIKLKGRVNVLEGTVSTLRISQDY